MGVFHSCLSHSVSLLVCLLCILPLPSLTMPTPQPPIPPPHTHTYTHTSHAAEKGPGGPSPGGPLGGGGGAMGGASRGGGGGGGGAMMPMGGGGMGGLFAGGMPQLKKTGKIGSSSESRSQVPSPPSHGSSSPRPSGELSLSVCVCVLKWFLFSLVRANSHTYVYACMYSLFLHFADFRSQNRVPNGPSDQHDSLPSKPSFGRVGAPPPPSRAPPSLPTKGPTGSGPPKPPPPSAGTRHPSHPSGPKPHTPSFQGRVAPPPKTDTPRSVHLCGVRYLLLIVRHVTANRTFCVSRFVILFPPPRLSQLPRRTTTPCTWGKRRTTSPASSE